MGSHSFECYPLGQKLVEQIAVRRSNGIKKPAYPSISTQLYVHASVGCSLYLGFNIDSQTNKTRQSYLLQLHAHKLSVSLVVQVEVSQRSHKRCQSNA